MKYKKFKEYADLLVKHTKKTKDIHVALYEYISEFHFEYESIIDILWSEILTEKGLDTLNWFMYEKAYIYGDKNVKMWDKDGKPLCKDLKALYDYLTEIKAFKI